MVGLTHCYYESLSSGSVALECSNFVVRVIKFRLGVFCVVGRQPRLNFILARRGGGGLNTEH